MADHASRGICEGPLGKRPLELPRQSEMSYNTFHHPPTFQHPLTTHPPHTISYTRVPCTTTQHFAEKRIYITNT